jgi:hypothetical protein
VLGLPIVIIEFRDTSAYLYNYDTPGVEDVETMKQLAAEGRGLATFMNKHKGTLRGEASLAADPCIRRVPLAQI